MRTTTLTDADVVVRCGAELAESPLWDPRRQRLLWVDIPAGRVHETDLGTGADAVVHQHDGTVGCVALRAHGGYVVATPRGVAVADTGWQRVEEVAALPGQPPGTRTNDGSADPWGSFWIGTLGTEGQARAGGLYRVSPRREVQQVLADVGVSNGLDWSPDRTRLYYDDTPTREVAVFDVDPGDGSLGERRTFATIELPGAMPDGLTVDAEGCVWVALWNGRRVRRYAPDGRLDREVLLPVDQVSCVTFAGPDLDLLVITTGREGLSDEQVVPQPLAGSVFVHRPGVRGRAANAWSG